MTKNVIARQCYVLLLKKRYYVAILIKSTSIYICVDIYIARIMLILKVPNLNLIYSQKCQSVMQVQNLIL